MYKINFGNIFKTEPHLGYQYLICEARNEGWALVAGIKEMAKEKWGATVYTRDGAICGIGFKDIDHYNDFCVKSGMGLTI